MLRAVFRKTGLILGLLAAACGADGDGNATVGTATDVATTSTGDDPTAPTTSTSTSSTSSTSEPQPGSTEESSGGSSSEAGDDAMSDASSSTGTPTVPEGCYDYYAFEPFDVSFRNDVMPIFVESCWTCHADPIDSGIFLGYGGNTEKESTMVHENLLSVTPLQAPAMTMIVPGDPLISWFMAKVEYADPANDCPLIDCPNPGCSLFAPPTEQLPEAQLAILRSWILDGALNN